MAAPRGRQAMGTANATISRPSPTAIAVGSFLVTALVYAWGARRGLSYDGSVTVGNFVATNGWLSPIKHQVTFNNHPLFSLIEHVVYRAGGQTELWLAAFPILMGALGVALIAQWVAAARGPVSGLVAAALVACNPTYAELSRDIRGYSLMAACIIGSTLIVIDDRPDKSARRRRQRQVAYVLTMAVGIGTHLYAVLAFGLHAVIVLSRQDWRRWVLPFLVAPVLGFVPYAFIARSMIEAADARATAFYPAFPREVAVMVLGTNPVAVLCMLPLAALAAWTRRSWQGLAASLALALPIGLIWFVQRPTDLYPRFLLPLVPLVAVAVVRGASLLPRPIAAGAIAASVASMIATNAQTWTTDPTPYKAAAGVVRHASALGLRPCIGSFHGEALQGYGASAAGVTEAEELKACDVLVIVGDSAPDLIPVADQMYEHRVTLRGSVAVITSYAHSAEALEAPPARVSSRSG